MAGKTFVYTEDNTLDLIEDCLSQIYRCRKSLLTRKRQPIDEIEAQSKQTASAENETVEEQQEANQISEERRMIEEITNSRRNFSNRSNTPTEGTVRLASRQSNPRPLTARTISKEELTQIYSGFQKELKEFVDKMGSLYGQEDEETITAKLEDMCEYLVEKYLTNTLDKVEINAQVSNVKMLIAKKIEELSSLESIASLHSDTKTQPPSFGQGGDDTDKEIAERELLTAHIQSVLESIHKAN